MDNVTKRVTHKFDTQQMESSRNIVIHHQNTQETCVVGVTREVDFEISNNGDRWVKCDLTLYEIKDAYNNIQLEIPSPTVMLHSTSEKIIKIKVKVTKMGPSIRAEFSVNLKDFVTQERWSTKHFICFVPEELQVDFGNINNDCLDFGSLEENMSRSLDIAVVNKNSVLLPLRICLIQNNANAMPYYLQDSILDIQQTLDFTLGPQMLLEQVIGFKGTTVAALTGNENSDYKGTHCIAATLNIELNNETERGMIIKSIPIKTVVSVCKVEVMETQIPLMIPQRRKVPFKVCNSGCVAVMVSATIVHSDAAGSRKVNKDFSSEPNFIILNAGEKGAFQLSYTPDDAHSSSENATMRITAGTDVHCHKLLGEQYPTLEQSSDSLTRCKTPPCAMSHTSPTSKSLMSSLRRFGRDSPGDSTSGVTVAGEALPIRSTCTYLSWSSVKIGTYNTKEFSIKNMSFEEINVEAKILNNNNQDFLLLKDRKILSSMIFGLKKMQSERIAVFFRPRSTGAAAAKVVFKRSETRRSATDGTGRQTKVIYLNGYGGSGNVHIYNALRDTSGQLCLSLGHLNSGGCVESEIKLENTGDLCSFAKINLRLKNKRLDMVSSWRIEPTELLINPHKTKPVTVKFKPKKEDLPALKHNDVSHVATLLITHGDEPTRWRIRRLFNKLRKSGGLDGKDKEAFNAAVQLQICQIFPGETMIEDLNSIRDTVDNIGDLCRKVRQDEVKLTIQTHGDDSTIFLSDSANESNVYHSLHNEEDDSRQLHFNFNNSYLP